MPRSAAILICLLLAPAPGSATEPRTASEILECLQRTRPLTNTVRSIRLVRRDRMGGERTTRGKVYGGVSRAGFRTILLEISEPDDLSGLAVLITEREGANHIFVSPAGLPEVRQIRGAPGQASLLGTDFSYEDVERLYGLARPGETHKLGSSQTSLPERSFWVLETTPARESGSSYQRIVSLIDEETCVLLRAEMFDGGDTPRKVLTSDPDSLQKEKSTWVARDVLIRDLREGSETRLVIDDIDLDVEHQGIPFTADELERYKRTRVAAPAPKGGSP